MTMSFQETPPHLRRIALFGLVAGAALLGTACKAPAILCTTAHAGGSNTPFAVRYSLTSGTGDCAMLTGGFVGVESYVNGGPGKAPSFPKPPVSIRAEEVGSLVGQYHMAMSAQALSSTGVFADEHPGPDGFCKVGPLSPVAVTLQAVPAGVDPDTKEMTPALPAMTVKYEWSNVSFYVSPSLIGTQFKADLKYTKDACTATYHVVGLYPGVGCEKTVSVMGCDGKTTDQGTGMPDIEACNPCADPAHGRATGSGISPDVDIVCDPKLLLCLPKADLPSLLHKSVECGGSESAAPASDAAAATPPPAPMCLDAAPMEGGGGGDDGGAQPDSGAAAPDGASGG
jgi:hypothetical protein